MQFNDAKLYACGEEGGGVAGYVRRRGKLISWFMPGGRSRAFSISKVLEETAERFVFVDAQRRTFELFELTPAYYNKHLRARGFPALKNEHELLEAFEQSLR